MKKLFYAVIHVEDLEQTLINADYAYTNGADGIFLINHAVSTQSLLDIYQEVRKVYPNRWIGLNFLGLDAEEAMFATPTDANGLWTDNAEIDEFGENIVPWEWFMNFYDTHPQCTYFGGVAFKYQRRVTELELAAEKSVACMDVICTSGPGTGIAADVEHVRRLAAGKGKTPLALASGVTPENIADFLPYADCFLVATGISKTFRMLDPGKVKELAKKVKAYNEEQVTDNVKFLEEMLLGNCYDCFEGCSWCTLLSVKPEYADKCDWNKFDDFDWWCIVDDAPQFEDKCPWDKLDADQWYYLLLNHPKFAGKCDWNKIGGESLCFLLQRHPQLARYCDWNKLDKPEYWWRLLAVQPQFADKCPWDTFGENFNWGWLLGAQVQFLDKCSLDKFDSTDWANFLAGQPQFAGKCPWNTLNGIDWSILLRKQPQFADKCPWKKMSHADWSYLLCEQPDLVEYCNLKILTGDDWTEILRNQPQLSNLCDWGKLNHQDWCTLLIAQPHFADKCNCWNVFDDFEWGELLARHPHLIDKCIPENLSGSCWSNILFDQPQLAEYCPWQKLEADDWGYLYTNQPQFIDIYNAIYENGGNDEN